MVLDADAAIRFLTEDDPQKADRFEKFLTLGEKIVLTDVTFAEIYWTLKSFYHFPKQKIIDALEKLITTASIKCSDELLYQTLNILKKKNISLIDAYNVAFSRIKNDSRIMSFDKGFDKIKGVKRVEP